jgi:hypothetical protein
MTRSKPQVYVVRDGTKCKSFYDKRTALKCLRANNLPMSNIRSMDATYYRSTGSWDLPTFWMCSDEVTR